ncbi:MFS transporter [Brevibacterium aurantiacum]|uniref:MFS transporter n=1 Tax=Brevibacterium aurantiacum TaxID=273384 RepID=UPI001C91B784|nr:MFS transporter [Brevibacterium aurantiacum]
MSPRVLYVSYLILWSMATLFMGMSGGFIAFIIRGLLVGGFEAPAHPIINKVATAWFPESERGRVIAFYTSGQFIGLALLALYCRCCRLSSPGTGSSVSRVSSASYGLASGGSSTASRGIRKE